MTVEVVIHRESSGRLRAAIRQEGRMGANLLVGHSFTSLGSAKDAIKRILWWKFRTELEIVWTVKA